MAHVHAKTGSIKATLANMIIPRDLLDAVRAGVAAGLKTLLSPILHEDLPHQMAELLRQFDQPAKNGANAE
jgi:hypothetical protein